MAKQDCLFCKIIKGKLPSYQVYETERVAAFLDLYPINRGHTLIVPKHHQRDIRDARQEDLAEIMEAAQKLANLYQDSLDAVGFNLKCNSGPQAHQEVMHLHFHLIPRYRDDGLQLTHDHYEASEEELETVQQNITSHLAQS